MSGLYDRIKQTVQKMRAVPADVKPAVPVDSNADNVVTEKEKLQYITRAAYVATIRKAGKLRRLLYISYDSKWRYVEPYSFRRMKQGMAVYGHCLLNNSTSSFYINKIQAMKLTDIPFAPRWLIEM